MCPEDRFRRTFLRDNTTYIDGLVSSVLDHDSLDTDYERELRATLNDIILVFIQNKINTFNLTDAQYQELVLELYALLDDFISNLNPNSSIEDIGLLRNQSRFLNSDYESRQLDRQNILPRSRYSFRYLKNPDSGSIETMQIKSRRAPDINFTSDLSLLDRARDTQRSVSRQIENNMPLFQIENVQTRIDDQDSFDSIVFSDLSDEELRSLDVSSSIEYVYRLLKSSLKIGSNAIGDITNLQADNMYIDALLRGEAPVVCRHIVYLFKIVSDSIRDRQVALLGTRAPLNGVSYFPIAMKNIHHATIGVSRGSYVTSLEPTWSLVRKQASIQNATFSREHGTSIPSIMEQFATSAEGMRQIVTSDVGDQMENSNYYSHQKSEVLEFINLSSPQVLCSKLKAILEGDVDLNNDDWPILVEYLTNYVNKTMNNLITEIPGLLLQQIFSLTEQILDKSVCSNSVCNTRLECLVVTPLRKSVRKLMVICIVLLLVTLSWLI